RLVPEGAEQGRRVLGERGAEGRGVRRGGVDERAVQVAEPDAPPGDEGGGPHHALAGAAAPAIEVSARTVRAPQCAPGRSASSRSAVTHRAPAQTPPPER